MSDDYLWDRSGDPDPDELALERILSNRSWRKRRTERQRRWRRVTRRVTIVATGAGGAILLCLGILSSRARLPRGESTPIQTELPAFATASAVIPEKTPVEEPSALASATPQPSEASGAPPTDVPDTLSSSDIQAVVQRNHPAIRRKCWEPQIAARDAGTEARARVSVSFTIAPNGSVQNPTTSGDPPGFPKLAGCIAQSVRSWQFPRAKSATHVNVPFVFVSSN